MLREAVPDGVPDPPVALRVTALQNGGMLGSYQAMPGGTDQKILFDTQNDREAYF